MRHGHTQNAVICGLRVGHVQRAQPLHVAGSTVWLLDVMLGGEGLAVAGEALGAKIGNALARRRRSMRIVARNAGHGVAGEALAFALLESLELADGANVVISTAGVHVVADEIGEIFAGTKFVKVPAGLFDGGIPF